MSDEQNCNAGQTLAASGLLAAVERELAVKTEWRDKLDRGVGTMNSIHEADYARGVVDGLRIARSYIRDLTRAPNNEAHRSAPPETVERTTND